MMEGKRLFLLVVLLCLFVGSPVVAENNSNLETVQGLRSSNDTPIVGSVIEMRPPLRNDELDEYQGDTVILGFTDYEDQHNSTVGRNLQFNPVLEQVYGAWDWYDNELNTRCGGIPEDQRRVRAPGSGRRGWIYTLQRAHFRISRCRPGAGDGIHMAISGV